MSVITDYVAPPIPTTMYDWVAYMDGDPETCGRGQTETEALRSLCERLHELLLMCSYPQ